MAANGSPQDRNHLTCNKRRVPTFVHDHPFALCVMNRSTGHSAIDSARARVRLRESIRGQHPIDDRHTRIQRNPCHTPRALPRDIVKVRRLPLYHRTKAHDRIHLA